MYVFATVNHLSTYQILVVKKRSESERPEFGPSSHGLRFGLEVGDVPRLNPTGYHIIQMILCKNTM